MKYKTGIDRKQLALLPICIDDYIVAEHICRVIHAFTLRLDMAALGFKYSECKNTGCPPYDPCMMLNLYLYGYLHRVRSSRRLEAETLRNIEVMWLMEGLTPDDRTICNFRKDNPDALRNTFMAFVQMCRRLGLYGEELVAADSVKFRADNSLKNHYGKTVVKKELEYIEKKINEYMNSLEEGDNAELEEIRPEADKIKAALEELKERKVCYEELQVRVAVEGGVSTVDSDSRLMRSGGDGRKLDVGYNVHTTVDSKYSLIVDFELTANSNDGGHLYKMGSRAKEILEAEKITSLTDKGYYSGEDIAACEANGIICLVAKPKPGGAVKPKEYSLGNFKYEKEKDVYICPCGNSLGYAHKAKRADGKEYRVYSNSGACAKCPNKSECTKCPYREVWRLPCQDVVDIVDERTRANKELYRRRGAIVEHPFGTIKAVWGFKQFLCRGKPKVSGETALAYLAYNMRRVINIFAQSKLMPVFG